MNIAKIFLTTSLLSSAAMVNAAESILITDVDLSRFCLYEEKPYSIGARIQVEDRSIVCVSGSPLPYWT